MSPSHRTDVKTNPRGVSADEVLKRLHPDRQPPTEFIPLPQQEPESVAQRPSAWLWALLYVSPWLIGFGTTTWLAVRTGSQTFLIVASLLSLALIVALFVMYLEHAEAKK